MMKYMNELLNNLGESKFGIIIKNPKKFVRVVQRSKKYFDLKLGSDYDEDYNLWDSKINGHDIMGVCCSEKYVIMLTSDIFNERTLKDVYTEHNIHDLESLADLLNRIGYKCKIGLAKKTCGCS